LIRYTLVSHDNKYPYLKQSKISKFIKDLEVHEGQLKNTKKKLR